MASRPSRLLFKIYNSLRDHLMFIARSIIYLLFFRSQIRTRRTFTLVSLFFFNDTATTEIYTLSLHDALPISFANLVHARSPAARASPPGQADAVETRRPLPPATRRKNAEVY